MQVKFEGTKEIFQLMIELLSQSSNDVKECVTMLWQSRSLSHPLCTSHETDGFLEKLLKRYNLYFEERMTYIMRLNDIKARCTSTDTDKLKHVAFELERKVYSFSYIPCICHNSQIV